MSSSHSAKKWVEANYPTAQGAVKAALILAYGAGLDAGLAEAQEIIIQQVVEAYHERS